jgi:hypothetical protein
MAPGNPLTFDSRLVTPDSSQLLPLTNFPFPH